MISSQRFRLTVATQSRLSSNQLCFFVLNDGFISTKWKIKFSHRVSFCCCLRLIDNKENNFFLFVFIHLNSMNTNWKTKEKHINKLMWSWTRFRCEHWLFHPIRVGNCTAAKWTRVNGALATFWKPLLSISWIIARPQLKLISLGLFYCLANYYDDDNKHSQQN